MAEKPSTRVDRLEEAMIRLADKQIELDTVMVTLAEAQIKTEETFRAIAAEQRDRDHEQKDRDQKIDERIDKLVIAIGEFIRRIPNGGKLS